MNPRTLHRVFLTSSLAFILTLPGIALAQSRATHYTYAVKSVAFKDGEKQNYNLKIVHPYAFTLGTLQRCMHSVAYQERKIAWSKRKRVFRNEVIKEIVPLIMGEFRLADKNSRVVFRIKNPRNKTILKGETFLTSKGLNWRITTLNYSKRRVDDFSIMGNSWRLVPLKGQVYKKKRPHKNLTQDITNWVVFRNIRPNPENILQTPKPSTKIREQPNIKEKLRLLEELKEEGLINHEEYEKKRQKVLNRL